MFHLNESDKTLQRLVVLQEENRELKRQIQELEKQVSIEESTCIDNSE